MYNLKFIKMSGINFYSQQGEDTLVFKNFINQRRSDGFFIELGGMDGHTYSNTLFFEQHMGFKGLLIEPTKTFQQLIKNRPNCINVNYAVGYKDGEDVEFIGEGAVAGMTETMNEKFRNDWHRNSSVYKVKSKRMDTILHENNIKYIDLFTIDVEGGELVVLETMDWNIPVYCVVIELDGNNKEKDEKCREILRHQGFTYVTKVSINEYWINKKYFRKDLLYKKDMSINFFNQKIHFHWIAPHLINELFEEFNKNYDWDNKD